MKQTFSLCPKNIKQIGKNELQSGLLSKANVTDVAKAIEELAEAIDQKQNNSTIQLQRIPQDEKISTYQFEMRQEIFNIKQQIDKDYQQLQIQIKELEKHLSVKVQKRLKQQQMEQLINKQTSKYSQKLEELYEVVYEQQNQKNSWTSKLSHAEQQINDISSNQLSDVKQQLMKSSDQIKQIEQHIYNQVDEKNLSLKNQNIELQLSIKKIENELKEHIKLQKQQNQQILGQIEIALLQQKAAATKNDIQQIYLEMESRAEKNLVEDQINVTKNDIYEDLVNLKEELNHTKQLLSIQQQNIMKNEQSQQIMQKDKNSSILSPINSQNAFQKEIKKLHKLRTEDLEGIEKALAKQNKEIQDIEKFIKYDLSDQLQSQVQQQLDLHIPKLQQQVKNDIQKCQNQLEEGQAKTQTQMNEMYNIVEKVVNELNQKVSQKEWLDDQNQLKEVLEEIQNKLVEKATINQVTALLECKAQVDEVNTALQQVHQDIENQRLQMLNQQIQKGSWEWKSGDLVQSSLIPWEIQKVNTDNLIFLWESSKTYIIISTPGYYILNCCFFSKPGQPFSIQLLVNGNCLAKISNKEKIKESQNAKKYQNQLLEHQHINIGIYMILIINTKYIGVEKIQYLLLQEKARISFNYHGQYTGEGYITLEKI